MSILQSDITSEQPVFAIYYDFFLILFSKKIINYNYQSL